MGNQGNQDNRDTLADWAASISGRLSERAKALDGAIQHQASIGGEKLVIRELLKVLSERQKASVITEIVLATEGCGDGEAEGHATSFQLVKFVFQVNSPLKSAIVQGGAA